jgi:hypothetical protein
MDGELIAARLELDKVLAASGGRVEAAPGAWRLAAPKTVWANRALGKIGGQASRGVVIDVDPL